MKTLEKNKMFLSKTYIGSLLTPINCIRELVKRSQIAELVLRQLLSLLGLAPNSRRDFLSLPGGCFLFGGVVMKKALIMARQTGRRRTVFNLVRAAHGEWFYFAGELAEFVKSIKGLSKND